MTLTATQRAEISEPLFIPGLVGEASGGEPTGRVRVRARARVWVRVGVSAGVASTALGVQLAWRSLTAACRARSEGHPHARAARWSGLAQLVGDCIKLRDRDGVLESKTLGRVHESA